MKLNVQGWIEMAAEVAHEANRGYCLALGDGSQLPWSDTPPNIKESARDGVRFIMREPDTSPAASHANWSAFKLADGWTYGPVKDMDAKTHPCLVPYDELPVEQRAKDFIFRGVVRAVLGL